MPTSANDEFDWNKIDRIGLYNNDDDDAQKIHKDIWKKESQAEAIDIINMVPNHLSSVAFRQLALDLLLSSSPSHKEEISSPKFLASRLDKLISIGAITEAVDLLQYVRNEHDDLPDNYDLSLIDIQLQLANNDLAPACLDIQASSNTYQSMPGWRELSKFCKIRFGNGDKINYDDISFKIFPALNSIIKNDLDNIAAPETNFGSLLIFADNKLSESAYNKMALRTENLSDLIIKQSLNKKFKEAKTYQCYALEAASRGIIETKTLASIYKNKAFPDGFMNTNGGRVNLHPCDLPAFLYQRLEQAESSDNDDRIKTLSAAISAIQALPARALLPLLDFIKDDDYANITDTKVLWHFSLLKAINNDETIEDIKNTLPLVALLEQESIDENDYREWLNQKESQDIIQAYNYDPALFPYFSEILSSQSNNFKTNPSKYEYENFFMLTYDKKSLGLGLGFNDFMAKKHNDKEHAFVVATMLASLGDKNVKNIHPYDLAVILSGLKTYKLEKKAIALVFEHLQY